MLLWPTSILYTSITRKHWFDFSLRWTLTPTQPIFTPFLWYVNRALINLFRIQSNHSLNLYFTAGHKKIFTLMTQHFIFKAFWVEYQTKIYIHRYEYTIQNKINIKPVLYIDSNFILAKIYGLIFKWAYMTVLFALLDMRIVSLTVPL